MVTAKGEWHDAAGSTDNLHFGSKEHVGVACSSLFSAQRNGTVLVPIQIGHVQ